MALTAAEKQKRYREHKKAELGENVWREKCNAADRLAKQKDPQAIREHKNLTQRKRRAAHKAAAAADQEPSTPPYSTKSSEMRAKRRAESVLPTSPKKRRVIVEHLAAEYGMYPQGSSPERPPPVNKIADDVRGRVREFYLRSDNSWMAPGRKDSITVMRDGKKVQEQRRYLLMTTSELHALYREQFPDDNIKVTSFRGLRPDTVLFKSDMPHNVCTCQYHENINQVLQALSPFGMPSNHRDLLQIMTCDKHNEECVFGRCPDCRDKSTIASLCDLVPEDKLGDTIKWLLWL